MNLEQELRAVLGQAAEMTDASRPDVDSMIAGGQDRRRRRNLAWAGGVAAAVVLVGGSIYGVAQAGRDDGDTKTAAEPTETTGSEQSTVPPYDGEDARLAPGTYRLPVAVLGDGGELFADVTFSGEGWESRSNPTVSDDQGVASMGVYQPVALAGGSGCSDDPVVTHSLGRTPESLAGQLTGLPRSEVVQPPTPTVAFGLDAVHLRLRIDPDCDVLAAYRPVQTAWEPRGMSYTRANKVLIVDFWVVEVDGILVVVDTVSNPDTPTGLVQQAADAAGSVTFVPAE
jgi:hypothetical protein